MTTNETALREAADTWDAFVKAREAMNAAIPDPMTATPAERGLYDERYRADHEAEREHFRTAIKLAQSARAILAALQDPSQPVVAEAVDYERWCFTQRDPETKSEAFPDGLPYLTVLLHRVCDNDQAKFEAAERLLRIAFEAGKDAHPQASPPPVQGESEDAACLRDIAKRIFQNGTPATGFDQGDVDYLYALAVRLTHPQPDTQEGEGKHVQGEKVDGWRQPPRHVAQTTESGE